MASKPGYNDYVFINCPFDDNYAPLLQALFLRFTGVDLSRKYAY
jgi:hypothetical protein